MSRALEVVILGSGSSGGVPRADGEWGACDPAEPRNRRSRCSLLLRVGATVRIAKPRF
jgi:phosphoribosyl 1,2-cyclic phosphate phosphodiesterase